MYTVSEACRAALQARTRTDRLTGTLTLTDGTVLNFGAADLMSGSVTIDNQCVNGQELEYGCVYMGQAAFQLRTALSRYALYGAKVTLTYGILVEGGWYSIPLGVYTVAEAERGSVSVRVKAYDNMLALCGAYPGTILQGTPYEMLCQIAEGCGLAVGCTEAELAAFPNGDGLFQLDATDGCQTWRDCLAALAQAVGGFGTVDRAGALVLRRFGQSAAAALDASGRSGLTLSDFRCHYCGVTAGGLGAYVEQDSGLVLAVENAPLLEKGLEERRQALLEALLPGLSAADYTPASLTAPGDPTVDPGDRLALPDKAAETLVTHLVWKFRGGSTFKGVGKNPHLSGGASQEQRTLHQLQTQAQRQKTIYYRFANGRSVTVPPGADTTLASVVFAPTDETTVLFLAQLKLTVTPEEDAETPPSVTVRYALNGTTLDYAPVQTVGAGPWLLALMYPIPALQGGTLYNWTVRLLTDGCTAQVEKEGLQAVITGQNLAGEVQWNGTLELEETFGPLALGHAALAARPLEDGCLLARQTPQTAAVVLALPALPLGSRGVVPRTLGGELTPPAFLVRDWQLTTASPVTFAEDWVTTENGCFALRRQFTVPAELVPVDEGLCCVVRVDTGLYKSVERIEVN